MGVTSKPRVAAPLTPEGVSEGKAQPLAVALAAAMVETPAQAETSTTAAEALVGTQVLAVPEANMLAALLPFRAMLALAAGVAVAVQAITTDVLARAAAVRAVLACSVKVLAAVRVAPTAVLVAAGRAVKMEKLAEMWSAVAMAAVLLAAVAAVCGTETTSL